VFVTADGVTLVDTKIYGWAPHLITRIKEITDKPVTRIINTHTHYDHTEGNPDFPATVEVVTHENTAKMMPDMKPPYGITLTDRNVFKDSNGRGLPKRTFKEEMTIGRGNDRIELRYFGRAHTSGDAFVIFPALRTMHTGDTFPNKGMPIMDVNNGQFCFADPRMPACCREQPGCMTTPCAPPLEPGMMMMFPGQTVHFVSVYRGARPRITLSWNLNHEAIAGDPIPYQVNRIS